ncbi:hypothetical protein K1719_007767 [Acacia pycnantha]|nr:hypothetical protein K1719_007767 [Acacia pycnantha]
MAKLSSEKSRRERRKESRLAKKVNKHQSWLDDQKSRAMKRVSQDSMANTTCNADHLLSSNVKETKVNKSESNSGKHNAAEDRAMSKEITNESKSSSFHGSAATIMKKGNKGSKENPRKKSKEFYEMGLPVVSIAAKKDQDFERKLAKKLKVKDGKLRGMDDGLNILLDGMSSVIDFVGEREVPSDEFPSKKLKKRYSNNRNDDDILSEAGPQAESISRPVDSSNQDIGSTKVSVIAPSSRKHKKRKLLEQQQEGGDVNATAICISKPANSCEKEAATMHVPALEPDKRTNEKYIAPHLRARAGNEPAEHTQIRRRIRGLLNRLSESNVESITGEISTIFQTIPRSVASQMISEEILASCSGGPRGNEQYAAVFAAFVAGMACLVGIDFSAKFMASFAKCFEDDYNKEDNLSLRNLTLLLCYLCIFGVCSSDLVYDFLIMLSKRLTEVDVSTILTVLQCCGMKIRADDPAAMKDFIVSVQDRANELKASDGSGQEKAYSKRMEFMLETICDIKNNKKRVKEDSTNHTRIKKWLQKLRVDDISIRGLRWNKLLDPDKKGQWWLSGDAASATDNVVEVANRIDKDVVETQRMLQLAAAQRMNTDARRAIFCIIMSGEDYLDAFEKLIRLDLPGKQDREVMRVLLECCLQEKIFNKYYTVLASRLCARDKNHKFTLQFCLWDHYKELESMQLMRSMHLAKFVAEMVASFTLSLSVLKTIELGDITQLTPKKIMHFRMFFESIFEYSDSQVWNVFTRVSGTPELESLRQGIEFFIKEYILKANKSLTPKFKLAKKALHNLEGVLM